jgi:uncharacterized protein YbbC (DUF1343 family)
MTIGRRGFLAASALGTAGLGLLGADVAGADPLTNNHHGAVSGADVLAAQGWRALAGKKVGVVSNPTGILADGTHIVDSMVAAGLTPVAAFGPEHGFRGTSQAGGSEGDYNDPRTGVPVYDAYGATADKLAGMYTKAGVDTVVFDIADVGSRFYTYIWTLYTAMKAAAKVGAAVVVLDRGNPIGGEADGPMLDPAFSSGIGLKPIVQKHGMTVGELARYYNGEFLPSDGGAVHNLSVVQTRGWRRDQLFSETDRLWVPPSPNMPTERTALVYPGLCLFEGTVLSEGRGTTRPFETIGAPNIDWHWSEALNAMNLPGVRFREAYFVPTFSKWVGESCGGVQVHITDERRFEAVRSAVAMIVTCKQLYPDVFAWRPDNYIDKLSGSARLRTMVDAGASTDQVVGAWQAELAQFRQRRRQYLLYR